MSAQPCAPLVVILEDDGGAAAALEMLISDWGYRSVLAADLKSLTTLLDGRDAEVSAIISDYHLRGGATGVDAIEMLKARGIDAPALLMTGTLRGKTRRLAASAGLAFMEKPVLPERLRDWLRRNAPPNLG